MISLPPFFFLPIRTFKQINTIFFLHKKKEKKKCLFEVPNHNIEVIR